MKKATLVSTPLTAVSIIEAFGDIKNFQPWAESVLSVVSIVKGAFFWPFTFVGIHFTDLQQSILLIAGILYFSHLASLKKFNALFEKDHMAVIHGDGTEHQSIVRPTYKFTYYVAVRKQTMYYFFAVLFALFASGAMIQADASALITDAVFYLLTAKAASDIFVNYTLLPHSRRYALREGVSALHYLRHMRNARDQGMIDDRYLEFERAHISRLMIKLRYNYEATRRITRLTFMELIGVLATIAALLAAFVLIRY